MTCFDELTEQLKRFCSHAILVSFAIDGAILTIYLDDGGAIIKIFQKCGWRIYDTTDSDEVGFRVIAASLEAPDDTTMNGLNQWYFLQYSYSIEPSSLSFVFLSSPLPPKRILSLDWGPLAMNGVMIEIQIANKIYELRSFAGVLDWFCKSDHNL